ncbi:MAG: adenine deaminase [Sphingobacteriales bacterium]|nr:MAG: adenine deaminase [Sphingobacteriales bacterium]
MEENSFSVSGQVVDVVSGRIFPGEVHVENGIIKGIQETANAKSQLIMPGLVDSHIHIESSMLVPSEFARLALVHGTVATVSDPHEIANVVGMRGIDYMIESGNKAPFYFNFGAPSCVPATGFETAGAHLGPAEIEELLKRDEIKYLSEMMNYPGVLNNDAEVMEKIKIAQKYGKPVDGHAPGLRGEMAQKYIAAGISTDHECFTEDEAREKLKMGMKILIREGSAAKNFDALISLIAEFPQMIMFCSDDKHPDELIHGHINQLVKRAIMYDFKPMDVLRAATLNPVLHYKLNNGLLQTGHHADFIIVNSLEDFHVKSTFVQGVKVAERGQTLLESHHTGIINHFDRSYVHNDELEVKQNGRSIRVIDVIEGQLITNHFTTQPHVENSLVIADTSRDILKLTVVNRYNDAPPAVAFVHNFGIKGGAIASTVAHDSHNIICVGSDDISMKRAINLLIQNKGGISVVSDMEHDVMPLPVAGLMSTDDGYKVAQDYEKLDALAKSLGSHLAAPFMTLSFLALLVIPELKLSDKGLFDGAKFEFTDLFV